MRKVDLVFILILFLFTFFRPEESILAKDSNLFVPFSEYSLLRPLPKRTNVLEVNAESYLSFLTNKNIVLAGKDIDSERYIASITKLMTAVVVMENYNLNDKITISARTVNTFSTAGDLKLGESFSVRDLLYMMLIESSNDAAEALSEKMGRDVFISLMNKKAIELDMKSTSYFNPSGLDFQGENGNISSANDIKKLVIYILNNQPLIYQILSIPEMDLYYEGVFHHKIETTNILLNESSDYIWGKTGFTDKAKQCIVLVMKAPFSNSENSYIINIVLGADDRFKEARIMEQWIKESFYW
ncbi:MAG: serine hydrolase [Candidatus Pacebacteria bacterium]|nr:serine hydrolase [Candidatus Paceibacterota bacterium]